MEDILHSSEDEYHDALTKLSEIYFTGAKKGEKIVKNSRSVHRVHTNSKSQSKQFTVRSPENSSCFSHWLKGLASLFRTPNSISKLTSAIASTPDCDTNNLEVINDDFSPSESEINSNGEKIRKRVLKSNLNQFPKENNSYGASLVVYGIDLMFRDIYEVKCTGNCKNIMDVENVSHFNSNSRIVGVRPNKNHLSETNGRTGRNRKNSHHFPENSRVAGNKKNQCSQTTGNVRIKPQLTSVLPSNFADHKSMQNQCKVSQKSEKKSESTPCKKNLYSLNDITAADFFRYYRHNKVRRRDEFASDSLHSCVDICEPCTLHKNNEKFGNENVHFLPKRTKWTEKESDMSLNEEKVIIEPQFSVKIMTKSDKQTINLSEKFGGGSSLLKTFHKSTFSKRNKNVSVKDKQGDSSKKYKIKEHVSFDKNEPFPKGILNQVPYSRVEINSFRKISRCSHKRRVRKKIPVICCNASISRGKDMKLKNESTNQTRSYENRTTTELRLDQNKKKHTGNIKSNNQYILVPNGENLNDHPAIHKL